MVGYSNQLRKRLKPRYIERRKKMNKVASILVVAVVLVLALVITGAQADNYLASISGAQNNATLGVVTVYDVAGGAAPVAQTIGVGYNASAVNFLSNGDLVVGQERYQGGSYTNNGVYVVDDYSYLGGGAWNTTPTELCVVDGQSYALSHGIVEDASGNIYVGMSNFSKGFEIMKYNIPGGSGTATLWQENDSAGTAVGDIRMDPAGDAVFFSSVSSQIWGFNVSTGAQVLKTNGWWGNYYGWDFGPNGNIFGGGYSLTVIEQMSAVDGSHVDYVAINGHTTNPRSLVLGADWNGDGTKDYYVADTSAANIQVYSGVDRSYLGTITAPASENNLAQWSSPVPEPSSLMLMIPGVASLVGLAIRRRRLS